MAFLPDTKALFSAFHHDLRECTGNTVSFHSRGFLVLNLSPSIVRMVPGI